MRKGGSKDGLRITRVSVSGLMGRGAGLKHYVWPNVLRTNTAKFGWVMFPRHLDDVSIAHLLKRHLNI